MASWTAPAFLDALKSKLDASADLSALTSPTVDVLTHWPGIDLSATDQLILGATVDDEQVPAAVGRNRHDQQVDVSCEVRVMRPGGGETVSKAARDRAAAIVGIVDAQLRTDPPDVADQTIEARITSRRMSQFPTTVGTVQARACVIEFTIGYTARTSP